jgi:cellulose synthase/poly-beta-1,6-N-acetylglucosamine synthase-like glycosyltransferase
VVDLELGGPAPHVPARYERVAVALRVHGSLVGVAEVQLGRLRPDGDALVALAAQQLREPIEAHLRRDGHVRDGALPRCVAEHRSFLERAPFASVIVASRDGERTLRACLGSLLELDYPSFEIILVDNASRGEGVASAARECGDRVRYVREERPGLALAHNRGLEEARGSIVAFTDDDVMADPAWLARLAEGFEQAPDVGCVTGLILPAELDSPAQLWLEGYWGLGKGFERCIFNRHRPTGRPLHPYTAGAFGSGANMAFRADALRALGGFDPALGTGSPARGGDDLAAFFDVLAAGHTLVYEPAAVVRHRHRRDYESLRRQAYGYGMGLSAYLAKVVADDPRRAAEMLARSPRALAYLLRSDSPKNSRRPVAFPRELTRAERRGMLAGPFAYARGRWQRRAMYRRPLTEAS